MKVVRISGREAWSLSQAGFFPHQVNIEWQLIDKSVTFSIMLMLMLMLMLIRWKLVHCLVACHWFDNLALCQACSCSLCKVGIMIMIMVVMMMVVL